MIKFLPVIPYYPKKIADIRLKLTQLQYPMLTKFNNLVESEVKKLQLPKGVHISWDRTFELEGVKVCIQSKKVNELNAKLKKLMEINLEPLFKTLEFTR